MRSLGVIGTMGLLWMISCGGGHSHPQAPPLPPTAMVLFPAGDASHGVQLWASDGTPQGTRILKQINPQGWAFPNSIPTTFTLLNGSYYFPAQDPEHGYELWRTDGTASGTVLVFDAMPGPDQGIRHEVDQPFVGAGGLFFKASWQFPFTSYLWRMDGSNGSIGRFLDGYPGGWPSYAWGMANWGSETVSQGTSSGTPWARWRTDGTPSGTRKVASGLAPVSALSLHSGRAVFVGYQEGCRFHPSWCPAGAWGLLIHE